MGVLGDRALARTGTFRVMRDRARAAGAPANVDAVNRSATPRDPREVPPTLRRAPSERVAPARAVDAEWTLAQARALGFQAAGVAPADPSDHTAHFKAWVRAGLHGKMAYLARDDALERRADPARSLAGFRSAVVVAHSYADARPGAPDDDPSRAVVARYARGSDYHGVMAERLERLADRMAERAGRRVARRVCVDTAPVAERELAQRAGLGWFGRNTMLIHPRRGSYFFLGALLTDLPLERAAAPQQDRCGSCRQCLDACPTGALLGRDERGAPLIDATRCISYLTIELKGAIPPALRPKIGNRVFGCDICQEVCPWNLAFSEAADEPAYAPRPGVDDVPLIELAEEILALSGKAFLRKHADSPMSRARRNGMLRNVCVALGNWGSPEARPVLERAARDASALVREHAEWALARIDAAAEGSDGP